MIPKIIHYCWYGGAPLPEKAKMCIDSWSTVMPDWEIRCWDETNTDLDESPYIRDAYASRHYAFVSDYVRMKVIEEYGGLYLDVDMELLKPLTPFLEYSLCLGTDDGGTIETMIMAEPHHPVMKEAYDTYYNRVFMLSDGSLNTEVVNQVFQRILESRGFQKVNERQSLTEGIEIFPDDYFQGISLLSGKRNITDHTYIVHWHTLLWIPWTTRLIRFLRLYVLVPIFGEKNYVRITNAIKKHLIN